MNWIKKSPLLVMLCFLLVTGCGGNQAVKPVSKPTPATSPAPASAPDTTTPSGKGGYYLDDGPESNPPDNLDAIPDAVPKNEALIDRSNKPYKALGQTYYPMKIAQNYKARGIASWYGKRFNGRKTSSGEIYDMYAMSAAHPTLPLPSYVRVTNVANGRSVIVRINDRGPFKHDRLIDLSYAAAYKLRLIDQGSGLVDVELIHPNQATSGTEAQPSTTQQDTLTSNLASGAAAETSPPNSTATSLQAANASSNTVNEATSPQYFIQAGAFKSEANATTLLKKIQGLAIDHNTGINRVYNGGLHRLTIGPYSNREEAEEVASSIRQQLNVSTIITNQ